MSALCTGNSKILVNISHTLGLEAFYFPFKGQYNHIAPAGVNFSFFINIQQIDDWVITPKYSKDGITCLSSMYSPSTNLNIEVRDYCLPGHAIFRRDLVVANNSDSPIHLDICATNSMAIGGHSTKNNAYYDQSAGAFVQSNADYSLCFGFTDHNGSFAISAAESRVLPADMQSLNDALEGNSSASGFFATHLGQTAAILPGQNTEFSYAITAHTNQSGAVALFDKAKSANSYQFYSDFYARRSLLPQSSNAKLLELATISKGVLLSHNNANGAIIASSDPAPIAGGGVDDYAYFWPRDGAFASLAMLQFGQVRYALRYLNACTTLSRGGKIGHRYYPNLADGPASWHPVVQHNNPTNRLQLDQLAYPLIVLEQSKDQIEKSNYFYFTSLLVEPTLRYLLNLDNFACFDVWENTYGIHTYTLAVIQHALEMCSRNQLLDSSFRQNLSLRAAEIKNIINTQLFNSLNGGVYATRLTMHNNNWLQDTSADISIVNLYKYGVISALDLKPTVEHLEKELTVDTAVKGVARKENDHYMRVSQKYTGNPWFLSALWLWQYYLEVSDIDKAQYYQNWLLAHIDSTGLIAEQSHPETGFSLGVQPLVWAHSELLITFKQFIAE